LKQPNLHLNGSQLSTSDISAGNDRDWGASVHRSCRAAVTDVLSRRQLHHRITLGLMAPTIA
jgi:hypothetical protein